MAADKKNKAYPVIRWIWVMCGYVIFAFTCTGLLTYCFASGNAVYPQGVPATQWQGRVIMYQLVGILSSLVLYLIWNIVFSYGCLGSSGYADKTAKSVLPFAILFCLALATAPGVVLFVSTSAINNFVVAPVFCSLVLAVFPIISAILFWLSAWLFSPDAIKYIGPYKQMRPSYLGG